MAGAKRLSRRSFAFFLMFVVIVVYAVNLQLAKAKFTVINASNEAVEVTASWAGQVKNLGALAPQAETEFELGEEVALKFRASHASGKISSATVPSYTLGSKIIVLITDATIEVKG